MIDVENYQVIDALLLQDWARYLKLAESWKPQRNTTARHSCESRYRVVND